MMYFFKAFFKDGSVEYFSTTKYIGKAKSYDENCMKIKLMGFLPWLFCKIFHPHS